MVTPQSVHVLVLLHALSRTHLLSLSLVPGKHYVHYYGYFYLQDKHLEEHFATQLLLELKVYPFLHFVQKLE